MAGGKSIWIHGTWGLVAAAAFGAGVLFKSGPPSAGDAGKQADRPGGNAGPSAREQRSARPTGQQGDREGADGGLVSRALGKPFRGEPVDLLVEQAFGDPNPVTRRLAFSRLLESLTPENALAVREQIIELGGTEGSKWHDFNYAWGAVAGQEAFDFGRESPERDMEAALSGWAAAKPDEAIALLDSLPEELADQRGKLTASVVEGLADYDQNMATDYVLRLVKEGQEGAEGLITSVANEVFRANGPDGASQWLANLPEGSVKEGAMTRVAHRYMGRDPEAAAAWVGEYAQEEFATRAIGDIGKAWAARNPVGAVDWLNELPESTGQLNGLRYSFGDWEDRDPVAAGEYLMQMPASDQRDAAISGFANGYAWQDPETAIAWAQDIGNPELRERSLIRSGQAYLRRNPEAARTWLETSGLSAEAQQQVLNPPRRRR